MVPWFVSLQQFNLVNVVKKVNGIIVLNGNIFHQTNAYWRGREAQVQTLIQAFIAAQFAQHLAFFYWFSF